MNENDLIETPVHLPENIFSCLMGSCQSKYISFGKQCSQARKKVARRTAKLRTPKTEKTVKPIPAKKDINYVLPTPTPTSCNDPSCEHE